MNNNKKNSRKYTHSAISEIIAALVLLGITVTAGILVWALAQNNEILNFAQNEQELNPQVISKLKVIGYDTRDSANLYNLSEVDNTCSTTCELTEDEYIIIKIRNDNNDAVEISAIRINEMEHVFDSDNANSGGTFSSTSLPMDEGEFIIISGTGTSNLRQEPISYIPAASDKIFILQLDLDDDVDEIFLNTKLRVVIDSSAETTKEYLIPAGTLA